MIELLANELRFCFPAVHPDANCGIEFQRTLRIPDDNRDYPLPPGLGRFPVEHVDDYSENLPEAWRQHGGVFIPMYQSEALWINFSGDYPCAIKIAAGKINAVSGGKWSKVLSENPQDYVVAPNQPWLDGLNVSKGYIRQFIAMPLGEGYTAEEQITGAAEQGGLQIIAYPMRRECYKKFFETRPEIFYDLCEERIHADSDASMGLAPGGLMRQKIYEDEYGVDVWNQDQGLRCFIHLVNSEMYQAITDRSPPHESPTAQSYTDAGLPWFDYYSDKKALSGAGTLGKLSSVGAKVIEKGKGLLPNNDPVQPTVIKKLGKENVVREGKF